jgi:hypothetical protein
MLTKLEQQFKNLAVFYKYVISKTDKTLKKDFLRLKKNFLVIQKAFKMTHNFKFKKCYN